MEHATSITPLDYAPAPWPWWKWIRRGTWFLFVLTLGLLAWQFGPWALKQAQIKYWQGQCMNFTLAPDEVVVEQEPSAVAKLLAQDSRMKAGLYGDDTGRIHTHVDRHLPEPLAKYLQTIFTFFQNPGNHTGSIFMHRMVQPDGQFKLVVLFYAGGVADQNLDFDPDTEIWRHVITPAGVVTAPIVKTSYAPVNTTLKKTSFDRHMRIYAGQIDPNDPSHFTIRYRAWGQEDVMDGRLDNNGNVTIKPRNWPKPGAPPGEVVEGLATDGAQINADGRRE